VANTSGLSMITLMMLLSLAGAGLVATIFVIASSSVPESTQHKSTEQNLRDADQLIAYRLERASRSLCRLLETVDTMKAEHERALMLDGQVSRGRTQRACSDVHSNNTGERTSSGSRGALVLMNEPHPRQRMKDTVARPGSRDAIRRASTEALTPAAMLAPIFESAEAWRPVIGTCSNGCRSEQTPSPSYALLRPCGTTTLRGRFIWAGAPASASGTAPAMIFSA
jgi:hypothetical protein